MCALTTEELGGTTADEREGQVVVGRGNAAKGRRIAKCGEWIRLGDAAADVVDDVHAALAEDVATGKKWAE